MSNKDGTAALSSGSTVDDISNDIGLMGISNDKAGVSDSELRSSLKEMTRPEKKCTSCDQKFERIKTDGTSASSDADTTDIVSENISNNVDNKEICANCGKEGANNVCNKCKQVKYCNAAVKRSIKQNIKRHVKDVLLSYVILNYSNNLPFIMEIVQSASYACHFLVREGSIKLVVEKLYAVGAFMQ